MKLLPHGLYGLYLPCHLRRVIDGDTVVISFPASDRVWHIRLLDCWAPPVSTIEGRRAGEFLLSRLDGKELSVFVPAPADPVNLIRSLVSFDRVLGRIFVDGRDISELMVAGGLATATKPKGRGDG